MGAEVPSPAALGEEVDTARSGRTYQRLEAIDAAACRTACMRDTRCVAYSVHATDCRLLEGVIRARARRGHVSGEKAGNRVLVSADGDDARICREAVAARLRVAPETVLFAPTGEARAGPGVIGWRVDLTYGECVIRVGRLERLEVLGGPSEAPNRALRTCREAVAARVALETDRIFLDVVSHDPVTDRAVLRWRDTFGRTGECVVVGGQLLRLTD